MVMDNNNNNNAERKVAMLTISECARRLGARPQDITSLFYRRILRDDLCPIASGRRLIPESYIDMIRMALIRAGRPVGEIPSAPVPPITAQGGVSHV